VASGKRQTLGRRGERRAQRYLQQNGLVPLTANFRTRFGEIDLVMQDGDCLVFVEVRYRKARGFASAAESIDRHKQRKLALAAEMFLRTRPAFADCLMRFDVVAIDRKGDGEPTLNWVQDAFRPDDGV